MTRIKTKRIVSDDEKHQNVESTASQDEESIEGTAPATGSDDVQKDTLEQAHDMGLYENQDDEHPGELGIDKEVDKDQEKRLEE